MNVEISTSETLTTLAERDHIQRRLRHALGDNAAEITQVQVWIVGLLRDEEDDAQYCLINVKLNDGNLIACDGTDCDLQAAIGHATRRVCLEVSRNLDLRQPKDADQIDSATPWYRDAAVADYDQNTI